MNTLMDASITDVLRNIALRAGICIMEIYARDFSIYIKDDHSPVTEADKQAEELILEALKTEVSGKLIADYPIVGEESVANGYIPNINTSPFWLVDPLDGTKGFIKHSDEFTVNIALIADQTPVLGVIHAPAIGATYWGGMAGAFADFGNGKEKIATRTVPDDGYVVVGSRLHRSKSDEAFLSQFTVSHFIPTSSSLKFCKIAQGVADLYPRHGRTMEWDTGAGHAILKAAGGRVTTLNNKPFVYGKPNFANDAGFIAWGK